MLMAASGSASYVATAEGVEGTCLLAPDAECLPIARKSVSAGIGNTWGIHLSATLLNGGQISSSSPLKELPQERGFKSSMGIVEPHYILSKVYVIFICNVEVS